MAAAVALEVDADGISCVVERLPAVLGGWLDAVTEFIARAICPADANTLPRVPSPSPEGPVAGPETARAPRLELLWQPTTPGAPLPGPRLLIAISTSPRLVPPPMSLPLTGAAGKGPVAEGLPLVPIKLLAAITPLPTLLVAMPPPPRPLSPSPAPCLMPGPLRPPMVSLSAVLTVRGVSLPAIESPPRLM